MAILTRKRLVLGASFGLLLGAFAAAALPLADLGDLFTPIHSPYTHDDRPPAQRTPLPFGAVEVPLGLWIGPGWPNGLRIGRTSAVSFGDYDGDGWIDLYSGATARLFHNEAGETWTLAADLDSIHDAGSRRYGSSLGDYDNDGLLDIITEPRVGLSDDCLHLLRNLGGGPNFEDVSVDPNQFSGTDGICGVNAETACWADFDDDLDQDLFVSAYAGEESGNFFFENLGPTGPNGAYRLVERTDEVGMQNMPITVHSRPEGVQTADYDRDGDVDVFAHSIIFQNVSTTGTPRFELLLRGRTGIGRPNALDEGAMFFDYDLDGDFDLCIEKVAFGNRLWENRGDGTFVEDLRAIENRTAGSSLGMSSADWDNDGDIDLQTTDVFRRNWLVEEGRESLEIAVHAIDEDDLFQACPAWGDWDRDGDLDVALANFDNSGTFYENTLYDEDTPEIFKTYARVRVVTDDPDVPRGLETEYGASVELRVHGDESGFVRRGFTAASHGYLNQSEYGLHFGLPPGPNPDLPAKGVTFDVVVDFPSLPENELLRVDGTVNPALAGIELWKLMDREITVFRSGKVVMDGLTYAPLRTYDPRLTILPSDLLLPGIDAPLAAPTPAPSPAWWVGVELDTAGLVLPVLLDELVLDGRLEPMTPDKGDANVMIWDVTPGPAPGVVLAAELVSKPGNRRSFFPTRVTLDPGRIYRVLARVTESRLTPTAGPIAKDGVLLTGGLAFQDVNPDDGLEVVDAAVDGSGVPLALRFRPALPPVTKAFKGRQR